MQNRKTRNLFKGENFEAQSGLNPNTEVLFTNYNNEKTLGFCLLSGLFAAN